MLETTIKVSREFRLKLKKAKKIDQTYQEFLEEKLPPFPFDDDYRFVVDWCDKN